MILMLEDDHERLERFASVLQSIDLNLECMVWNNAYTMIRDAQDKLQTAFLISLEHDLVPEEGKEDQDPGDGYMVAKWLTSQSIVRPVIIHTSNVERSTWMEGEFELAGWRYWRVPPLGDDWIETDWKRIVKRLIKKAL